MNSKGLAGIALFLWLMPYSQYSFAQTIWCKKLNLGCPTAEDIAKKARVCKSISDEIYQKNLNEGLLNESLWRLQGYSSAHENADAISRVIYRKCMEN